MLRASSFEPLLACDGRQALEILDDEPVDLVLLDCVMPQMDGFQFCHALRARPKHGRLPVVLMSAKGDSIQVQFAEQTGAVGAITKPFDARALVAVVQGALRRPTRSWKPERVPSGFEIAHELATALGVLLAPEFERLENPTLSEEDVRLAINRAVSPSAVSALVTRIRSLHFGAGSREALAGDIAVISIAEVLQLLTLQRQSGALALSSNRGEITLYVRDGFLDFAAWRGLRDEFLIGRYLADSNALSQDTLHAVLEETLGSDRLLGETLVERDVVSEEEVRRALVNQTSELIYEAVRWNAGHFSFTVGAVNPMAEKARLGLEPSALMMEGFRRVDEWRLIEESFDFDEVLLPDPLAIERFSGEAKLTNKEQAVLDAIDGERTIRELLEQVNGGSFELCKIVYQLLNSRLVRRQAAA